MTTQWPVRSRSSFGTIGRHAWTMLLASSLLVNVAHGLRMREQRRAQPGTVREGTTLPALDLVASNGARLRLRYTPSELPTILYFFSPSCAWCERNWENVTTLERLTRGTYRFVPLSTTPDVERVRAAHDVTFEIYSGLTEELRRIHGFSGTPHTIVVSPTGRVLKAWAGAYNDRVIREIEAYFQVTLPGLTARS